MLSLSTSERRVLDTDFSKEHSRRDEVLRYLMLGVGRGDVRLDKGLFRTEEEQEEFIRYGLRLEIPLKPTTSSLFQRAYNFLRRYIKR